MPYLLKTEPEAYSFDDLRRAKRTEWDGVTNPAAVKNLREMSKGEPLIIYHTGKEKREVGTAKVVSADASGTKSTIVVIKAEDELRKPVTLAEMNVAKVFSDSTLLLMEHISFVPQ